MRYRDELDRDYIDVKSLSGILEYTPRHVKRLLRTNGWINLKRHGKCFVLINDVVSTYPDSMTKLYQKGDIEGTRNGQTGQKEDMPVKEDVQNVRLDVHNVQDDHNRQTEMYEVLDNRDKLYTKTVSTIQKLERSIVRFGYIQADTEKIKGDMGQIKKDLSLLKKPKTDKLTVWLQRIVLIVCLLVLWAVVCYFYYYLKAVNLL